MGLLSYDVARERARVGQSEQELEWESNSEPDIEPDDSDSEPVIEQE